MQETVLSHLKPLGHPELRRPEPAVNLISMAVMIETRPLDNPSALF